MVMASRGLGMLKGYLVCDASFEILHSHTTIIMFSGIAKGGPGRA